MPHCAHLIRAAHERGERVFLATSSDSIRSPNFEMFIQPLRGEFELIDLGDLQDLRSESDRWRRLRDIGAMRHAAQLIVWKGINRSLRVLHPPHSNTLHLGNSLRTAVFALIKLCWSAMAYAHGIDVAVIGQHGRAISRFERVFFASCPDPVDFATTPESVRSFRNRMELDRDRRWFGIFGNIVERKNPRLAVEVLTRFGGQPTGLLLAGTIDEALLDKLQGPLAAYRSRGGQVRILNSLLPDEELDSAIASVDSAFFSCTQGRASQILGKAVAAGVTTVAAGSRALRKMQRRLGGENWTALEVDKIVTLLERTKDRGQPQPRELAGGQDFAEALLGRNARVAQAVLLILLARTLGLEDFGRFSIAYASATLAAAVLGLGASSFVLRAIGLPNAQEVARTLLVVRVWASTLLLVLGVLTVYAAMELSLPAILGVSFAATELLIDYAQAYIAAGARLSLLAVAAVCFMFSAESSVLEVALMSLSVAILLASSVLLLVSTRGRRAGVWRTIRQSTGYWAGSLVGNIRQLEPNAVAMTLSTSVAGAFAFSARLVNPLLIFTSTLQTLFMPVLAANEDGSESWRKARKALFWLCLSYALVLCGLAPFRVHRHTVPAANVMIATALSALTNYHQIMFNARGFAWDAALIIGAGNALSVILILAVGYLGGVGWLCMLKGIRLESVTPPLGDAGGVKLGSQVAFALACAIPLLPQFGLNFPVALLVCLLALPLARRRYRRVPVERRLVAFGIPVSSVGNYAVLILFLGYFLFRRSGSFDVARLLGFIAIGNAASYLLFGSEDDRASSLSDLWKFSIGVPATIGVIAVLITSKWSRFAPIAMIFMAAVSLSLNFRSLALVSLAAAALSFFFAKARSRAAGLRAVAAVVVLAMIAMFSALIGVWSLRRRGSRTYRAPLSIAAILRHPLIGWGSAQNIDRDTVSQGQAIAKSVGMVDPNTYLNYWIRSDGRISLHSILLGSWAEGGVVAALLPLLLIGLFVWGALRSRGYLAPLAILVSVQGVWDLICTSGRKIARQVVTVAVVAHSDKPGGAERYLVELYREASSPILLGQLPGWNEAGLPARRVELSPKWSRSTIFGGCHEAASGATSSAARVAAEPIDYFHLQFKREQVGFSRELSRIAPVVWTEHGRFIRGPQGALLARAYRRASRHVSGIVCVSETVAKSLAAIVHPSVQLEVIENGVSLEGFRPASEGTKALPDVHEGKDPGKLLSISETFPGHVLVAGDGPLRAELERKSAHLPNLRWLGHMADVRAVLDAADVFIFTSRNRGEGYPTTSMLEAAASGLPIVTDVESGAEHEVRASGGALVRGGDWKEAIQNFVGGNHDLASWRRSHEESLTRLLGHQVGLGVHDLDRPS
ncbi:hypothetical protein Pfo_031562 [Paulownia fortunei]|nr:hypothetical protein Pfo_031562 [Paulownia fortunei]